MSKIPPKRKTKYPWASLRRYGDMFLIPLQPGQKVPGSLYELAERRGVKITTRRVDAGVEVWRDK